MQKTESSKNTKTQVTTLNKCQECYHVLLPSHWDYLLYMQTQMTRSVHGTERWRWERVLIELPNPKFQSQELYRHQYSGPGRESHSSMLCAVHTR